MYFIYMITELLVMFVIKKHWSVNYSLYVLLTIFSGKRRLEYN